jgi:hypothetical protein
MHYLLDLRRGRPNLLLGTPHKLLRRLPRSGGSTIVAYPCLASLRSVESRLPGSGYGRRSFPLIISVGTGPSRRRAHSYGCRNAGSPPLARRSRRTSTGASRRGGLSATRAAIGSRRHELRRAHSETRAFYFRCRNPGLHQCAGAIQRGPLVPERGTKVASATDYRHFYAKISRYFKAY